MFKYRQTSNDTYNDLVDIYDLKIDQYQVETKNCKIRSFVDDNDHLQFNYKSNNIRLIYLNG